MPQLLLCLLWLISLNLHAATLSTRYSYDEAGNKTSQTDALGHVTQWTYSVLNQITSRTLPDGSRESFSYDSTGQLTSHTNFNNQTTRYGYDALNRLILTQYPDGRSVKNTYNASQQLDTVTESQTLNGKIVNQTTKYNYDINDRLVKVTYPNNQSISYSYDAVGNLLTRSTVNGTTKYTYDLNDRLATVTDSQGGLTRLSYDAVGNKTERILANGIKTTWQYNSRNQLIGLSHRQADGTLIADYQYTLDAKGNRTAITETLVNEQGQSHQRQLAYSYDNVDRLTSETVTDNDNAFGGSYSRTYQYDSVANRSQQSHTANNQTVTTTYSYDVNDQLQSETTGSVQTNYRYDKNGNLIEKYNAVGIIAQYRYNPQNQLTEVILPQVTYRYAYDSQGNRIQSQQLKNGQTETTQYLVDTNFNYAEVIEEKDGQGQLLASHTFTPENTGDLLSITNASKESRYTLEDGLGSLRQITNTLGQVQGSQATTAWGENLNNTTKIYTDYGYTGEKQNTETGLVYLRAREYMPSVGRFVQRDTWAGIPTKPVTLNQFLYADANGVNKKDPSGRMSLGDVGTAIAINGTLGGTMGVLFSSNNNHSLESMATNFIVGAASGVALGGVFSLGAKLVKLGRFSKPNFDARIAYSNLLNRIGVSGTIYPGRNLLAEKMLFDIQGETVMLSSNAIGGGALKHLMKEILGKSPTAGQTTLAEILVVEEAEAALHLAMSQRLVDQAVQNSLNLAYGFGNSATLKTIVQTGSFTWEVAAQMVVINGQRIIKVFHLQPL